MQPKVTLFITASISALVGAAISLGISNSEAQPAGAKQFQFVVTGTSQDGKVKRYEDLEYEIVCYTMGDMAFSCAKK